MSEFNESASTSTVGAPRWVGLAVAVLGGLSLIGLGVGWSALNQARSVEQTTQSTLKQANEALSQRMAKEDEINQQLQSDLKVVTDKLNVKQTDLVTARKQDKTATKAVDKKVTNLKKNQYTINVLADDKSFEKKNRSVNEPIFFYTGGSRQALELVINKVTKSSAAGYLSVPKAPGAASASTATSGK